MKVRVLENRPVGGGCYSLSFEWPFGDAQPGQFIMVRVRDGHDPLLRRPMSIASQFGGSARVVFKPVGRGTEILSHLQQNDELDIIGPFGNFMSAPKPNTETLLVGGGVGVPPLLFYAERNRDSKIIAVIGGATIDDILLAEDFSIAGAIVVVATEDGSMGSRGMVTDVLTELKSFKESSGATPATGTSGAGGAAPTKGAAPAKGAADATCRFIACGPLGMLKALDKLAAKSGIEGELSLEEKMGCGFGVCLGCMVETKDGRKRVCAEGPIFKTGELKWR